MSKSQLARLAATKPVVSQSLSAAVYRVWQQIGFDMPEDTDNECAVEVCLDADRLVSFGEAAADAEYRSMIAQYGYPVTFAALCKAVKIA